MSGLQLIAALQRYPLFVKCCLRLLPVAGVVVITATIWCTLYWGARTSSVLFSRKPSPAGKSINARFYMPQNKLEMLLNSLALPRVPLCSHRPLSLIGAVKIPIFHVNSTKIANVVNTDSLRQQIKGAKWNRLFARHGVDMFDGGHYKPKQCRARQELGIIIPYRDREQNLYVFLNHMLPILKRQQLQFKIYVIEQAKTNEKERFNRGLLMNIGFAEALREIPSLTCVIFHDVDLILEDDRNLYVCDVIHPRHLSVAVSDMNYTLPYASLMGGVVAFPAKTFRIVNGFSNLYWGWGVEDDDLAKRVEVRSRVDELRILRPDATVARYTALSHKKHTKRHVEPDRSRIRQFTEQNMPIDGLTSLKYVKVDEQKFQTFTWIDVAVRKIDYRGKMYRGYPWKVSTNLSGQWNSRLTAGGQ